jgi:hypothetical protein
VPKKQNAKWRSLDETEIALAKRMNLSGLPRDYIHSFFVRPGRVISPAFVSELDEKRPEIAPATTHEVEAFIARRLSEANRDDKHHGFGPTSSLRVREILQLSQEGQRALPGFESHFAEFKSQIPANKIGKANIAKSLVAFANHQGGYIFIGVANDGTAVGVPPAADVERFWDELSDVVTGHFTPFFQWDRGVVEFNGKLIAVAYAYEAAVKPIIASDGYTTEILPGQIFFRYSRSSEVIRAGDLIRMLNERDRQVLANGLGNLTLESGEAAKRIA